MANVKISDLSSASTPLTGAELVPIVQSGVTKQTTVDGINYFKQNGTGAVATTVQTKLLETVSVLDFGADPTGSTDSRDSFQNAIDSGLGQVFVPAGNYRINSSIVLSNGTSLIGEGIDVTTIKYYGTGGSAIDQNGSSGTPYVKINLEGFSLQNLGTGVNGIFLYYTHYSTFNTLRISGFTNGVGIGHCWDNEFNFVISEANTADGFNLSTVDANALTFILCQAVGNGRAGFYASGGRSVICTGCNFEANTQYGIYLTSATTYRPIGHTFQGCYIEGNGTHEIYSATSTSSTLSGVAIAAANKFTCTSTTLCVGMAVTISGTAGGTGAISGYSDPTTYYIIGTNGSTEFYLSKLPNGPSVSTTSGTLTGLTYTVTFNPQGIVIRDNYFEYITGKATSAINIVDGDGFNITGNSFDNQDGNYTYSLYMDSPGNKSNITWGRNWDSSTLGVYSAGYYYSQPKLEATAWGVFNGKGSVSAINSIGVSGITRTAAGSYTVNLINAMPSTTYVVTATSSDFTLVNTQIISIGNKGLTSFQMIVTTDAGALMDGADISFVVYG